MTISRTPTGGRDRQRLVVAPSRVTRARLSSVEPCSNNGWPTWPKRSPTNRGRRALLDGADTGFGLRSSNCGRKERTACTIGSGTGLSPEAGGSSDSHPDDLAVADTFKRADVLTAVPPIPIRNWGREKRDVQRAQISDAWRMGPSTSVALFTLVRRTARQKLRRHVRTEPDLPTSVYDRRPRRCAVRRLGCAAQVSSAFHA